MTTDSPPSFAPFCESNLKEGMELLASKEGDYCYIVNARWPKWGWSPRKQYRNGKWRFAWWGRPHFLVCTDPAITEKLLEILNGPSPPPPQKQ